jgi:hypothetical protein
VGTNLPRPRGRCLGHVQRDQATLADLPLIRKDLGAFDPDPRGRHAAVREILAYRRLLDGITVVEVSGRVDVAALPPIVDDLLA